MTRVVSSKEMEKRLNPTPKLLHLNEIHNYPPSATLYYSLALLPWSRSQNSTILASHPDLDVQGIYQTLIFIVGRESERGTMKNVVKDERKSEMKKLGPCHHPIPIIINNERYIIDKFLSRLKALFLINPINNFGTEEKKRKNEGSY